jgi:hypothetical protein
MTPLILIFAIRAFFFVLERTHCPGLANSSGLCSRIMCVARVREK